MLKYIDDLENGKIPRQRNLTIPQQSEIQRCNLLSEAEEIYHKNQEKTSTTSSIVTGKSKSRSRSSSSSSGDKSSRRSDKKQKRRSKSKSPYRSRSHYSSSSSHSQSSSRKKYRNWLQLSSEILRIILCSLVFFLIVFIYWYIHYSNS